MIQPLGMLLDYRTILGVKSDELGERREPDVAPNVELPLAVSDDSEVMDVHFSVEEREHHCTLLAAALPH